MGWGEQTAGRVGHDCKALVCHCADGPNPSPPVRNVTWDQHMNDLRDQPPLSTSQRITARASAMAAADQMAQALEAFLWKLDRPFEGHLAKEEDNLWRVVLEYKQTRETYR